MLAEWDQLLKSVLHRHIAALGAHHAALHQVLQPRAQLQPAQ